MDVMEARRRLLMTPRGIDTSPKIIQYGVYWNRTFGSTTINPKWCITDWYNVQSATGRIALVGRIGNDGVGITFQYFYKNGNCNWYYFNVGDKESTRSIGSYSEIPIRITFSVEISVLDDCYVYIAETGQILFAGKNSIYYGHRNTSELN